MVEVSYLKQRYSHILCAALVFVSGLVTLTPINHARLNYLHRPHLFALHAGSLVLGFLALYFSLQLIRRKKIAYWIVLLILFALLIFNVFHDHHPWRILLYIITVVTLIMSSESFTVKSSNLSIQRALVASTLVLGVAIVYAAAGFYLIDSRAFGINLSLLQSVKYAVSQLFLFDTKLILPLTREAHLFILSLDLISVSSFFLIVFNLFRPVRFALFPSKQDLSDATKIVKQNSTSVEDFFKLWPQDKHYFFNTARSAVIAYNVQSGVALAVDGPSGNKRTFKRIMNDFTVFCNHNGWTPAFIHTDEKTKDLAAKLNYKSLFIGNEAIIDVHEYLKSTANNKHFRYVENKAKRDNLVVEFWESPLNNEKVRQLKTVSDNWLHMPGRSEYTFMMGYFDSDYIRDSEVVVLKRGEDVIAYVNLIPSYIKNERSIDHMRHTQEMSNVGIHYLLKKLIENLHKKRVARFNLGLSPLSGLEELTNPSVAERMLPTIKRIGSRYYSFAGLEQFKNKFKPNWQPRYILYKGTPARLLPISNGLNKAISVPVKKDLRVKLINVISLVAGVSYLSFFLANLLGLNHSGLASELGANGNPYNWLFNGFDVFCGILVIYLAYTGITYANNRVTRWQYGLFSLGGFGNIMAALIPINITIGLYRFEFSSEITHAVFSAISVLGFCSSALLYTLNAQRYRPLILALFISTMFATTASLVLVYGPFAGLSQRLQLTLIGIFIALIGKKSIKAT